MALSLSVPFGTLACSSDPDEPREMNRETTMSDPLNPVSLGVPGVDESFEEDELEISIDGVSLPLDPVEITSSVVLSEQITVGLGTTVPDTSVMMGGDFGISVSVNRRVPGVYPLIRNSFDVDDSDDPVGHVTITTTDLTGFDPVTGSMTVESLELSEPDEVGRFTLDELSATFEGTFRDDQQNEMMVTGKFAYR
jgi:hypothetical protein